MGQADCQICRKLLHHGVSRRLPGSRLCGIPPGRSHTEPATVGHFNCRARYWKSHLAKKNIAASGSHVRDRGQWLVVNDETRESILTAVISGPGGSGSACPQFIGIVHMGNGWIPWPMDNPPPMLCGMWPGYTSVF